MSGLSYHFLFVCACVAVWFLAARIYFIALFPRGDSAIISFSDLKISEVFCFYYDYDENDPEGRDTLLKIKDGIKQEYFKKTADNKAVYMVGKEIQQIEVPSWVKVLRIKAKV